MIFKNPQK